VNLWGAPSCGRHLCGHAVDGEVENVDVFEVLDIMVNSIARCVSNCDDVAKKIVRRDLKHPSLLLAINLQLLKLGIIKHSIEEWPEAVLSIRTLNFS
jgi:hypothetical protein